MHFEFAIASSDIDLWDIDLLDTDLDILNTDILSKHFFLSLRRLEDISKTCLDDVFKMPWRATNVFWEIYGELTFLDTLLKRTKAKMSLLVNRKCTYFDQYLLRDLTRMKAVRKVLFPHCSIECIQVHQKEWFSRRKRKNNSSVKEKLISRKHY